ncbi:hypothetical protein CLOSYM_03901 [[Clostridium] symbiosum ATCC 14940]|uniref:Uncharacterized protein n=1 Tax=[Clostridium] symbiosum ATCC 14940 TaxID=411472 RepID=A0ABC9TTB3_CLOSY|nr:hypothetical protein CLOSYM_03901 [[Clostridium] symbiosum ATCC 14940]
MVCYNLVWIFRPNGHITALQEARRTAMDSSPNRLFLNIKFQ